LVLLGAVSAIVAAVLGWFHAASGYGVSSPRLLAWHRWLGTATAVGSVILAVLSEMDNHRGVRSWTFRLLLVLVALLVAVAGHFGGLLVHGVDYFECFQHHKLTPYNEALVTRGRIPIMFFVVKDAGPQSSLGACLDQVEHYLIQLAVQHNSDLANVKRVEWSIPGVFHAGPGHSTASAMALRQILGLAVIDSFFSCLILKKVASEFSTK
jgi:hypothetical protein